MSENENTSVPGLVGYLRPNDPHRTFVPVYEDPETGALTTRAPSEQTPNLENRS